MYFSIETFLPLNMHFHLSICSTVKQFICLAVFPSVFLFICLKHVFLSFVCLYVVVSVCLCVCVCMSICLSILPFICLHAYLPFFLTVFILFCPSLQMSVSVLFECPYVLLSVYLSVCSSIHLSVYLVFHVTVYLFVHPSICLTVSFVVQACPGCLFSKSRL